MGVSQRPGRVRTEFDRASDRAQEWLERRRHEAVPMDLAVSFYERDRELFASVLGAAIALRLFLFLVPVVAGAVAVLTLVLGQDGVRTALAEARVAGELAGEVTRASDTVRSSWPVVVASALWLSIWAGRNLAIVLAACSGAAWQLDVRASRVTLRAAGTITALAFSIVVTATLVNRLREQFGLAGATSSWVVAVVAFGAAWFAVCWALPRGTRDPAAILPGAVLVGVSLAALQWFMQFYLPPRLERATALAGSAGLSVAVLAALFLIGRVMAASFALDAVLYDRLGSISGFVFGLPVLRRIPRRFPTLAEWFDLGGSPVPHEPDTPASSPCRGDVPSERSGESGSMSNPTDAEVHGPIDFVLLEFSGSNRTGEVAEALLDLVERGVVRIFDLVVVRKDTDGTFSGLVIDEALPDEFAGFLAFSGARSGLLGDDDLAEAGRAMEPGTVAALIVYENTWAVPFVAAARRAGGELIASTRLSAQDVMDVLDELEAAT